MKRKLEAAEKEIRVMKQAKVEVSRERDTNDNPVPATNEDEMEVVPTNIESNDQASFTQPFSQHRLSLQINYTV